MFPFILSVGHAPSKRTLFPYTPLFRSINSSTTITGGGGLNVISIDSVKMTLRPPDRKSTRLNSSHRCISYAVFCLKKKKPDSRTNSSRLMHNCGTVDMGYPTRELLAHG